MQAPITGVERSLIPGKNPFHVALYRSITRRHLPRAATGTKSLSQRLVAAVLNSGPLSSPGNSQSSSDPVVCEVSGTCSPVLKATTIATTMGDRSAPRGEAQGAVDSSACNLLPPTTVELE